MLSFALAVMLASVSAARADNIIGTKWRLTGEAQGDCIRRAAIAIDGVGFKGGEPSSQSVSGSRGDYTASIRCVSEQRVVFFVVTGPSASAAAQLLDAIYEHY
jgi:hypothetical protein